MRIGIDGTCWANPRGYGRFTRELCRALAPLAPDDELVFFLDRRAADVFDLAGTNVRTVVADQRASPTEAASADSYRSPLDMLRLTRTVRREPLDVFLSPTAYSYFPLPFGLPAVVTVMDTIAERHPELTLPSRRARLFWRAKVKLALWQGRIVLTLSEHSARELGAVYGVRRERIRVSVAAPSETFAPSESRESIESMARRVGLPDGARWFVYVGGFNPHKNVDAIVRAHASLAGTLDDPPHLLLVGAIEGDVFHGDRATIQRVVEASGTEALVHWTGFLPDEDLRHLHSGALALVLVSELEGLGLPALEAAACGAPVIATTSSPLPELLEGGGIFVDPGDEAALSEAMRRFADDEELRRSSSATALARARDITWPAAAEVALAALREVASC